MEAGDVVEEVLDWTWGLCKRSDRPKPFATARPPRLEAVLPPLSMRAWRRFIREGGWSGLGRREDCRRAAGLRAVAGLRAIHQCGSQSKLLL